ncbi:MAG TPA: FAD-dependent monooxygenase [Candidatus Lokiarchaeia archaeon]|nr:FAD-dependent monooxygenase [Candidatus Lokiarchaeia archaeon]
MKKDIIIAGGGAGGSIAAWLAAEQDLDVAVIDAQARGSYHPCSGVYPLHSFKSFPPLPDSVFERDMVTMRVMSPDNDAVIDAREFSTTLGKVILRSRFDEFMLDSAEKRGAEILDSTRITKAEITDDHVSVHVKDSNDAEAVITGDILFLATGTSGFRLHAQLGIETPPVVETVIGEFQSSEDHIENVLSSGAYHYYVNKKSVSKIGPFWITCRKDSFNAGIIDYKVTKERFIETTRTPRLKDLFTDASDLVLPGQASSITKTLIPCAPIKTPYGKRLLVLGDAAGLAHAFYYEGVWEARESAKHAVDLVARLRSENKPFTAEHLAEYKKELARQLVNKFLRSGRKNSWLFWQAQSDEAIWNYFCDAVRKRKDFRKLLVSCFEADYAATDEDIDFKAGEMIFQTIPTLKKVLYAPYFLKAGTIK